MSVVGGADSARGSGSGVASQVPDRAHRCFGAMSPNLALEAEQGDGVTKTELFNLKKCGGLVTPPRTHATTGTFYRRSLLDSGQSEVVV